MNKKIIVIVLVIISIFSLFTFPILSTRVTEFIEQSQQPQPNGYWNNVFDFENDIIPFNASTGKLSIYQRIPTNKVLKIEPYANIIFLIKNREQFTIEFNLYLIAGLFYQKFSITDGIENKLIEVYGVENQYSQKYYTISNKDYNYQVNDDNYVGESIKIVRIQQGNDFYFNTYLTGNQIGHILDKGNIVTDFSMYFTRATFIDNFKIY
jgi:hypothetical protein